MKIYQKLNFGFGGCDQDDCKRLGLIEGEFWSEDDIKILNNIKLDTISDIGRKFLLSKRAMRLDNGEVVVIPRGELAMAMYLGQLYKLYLQYKTEEKEALKTRFENKLYVLRIEIAKRLFSKKFSDKYQFNFKGFSGIALSHARAIEEILVPEWFGLKEGDLVLVTRDPVQNIVVTCRVAGFTKNEIRVNPKLIVILAGDFDGDKIQVIPINSIYTLNKKYFDCTYLDFRSEMESLMLNNFKFKELIEE